MEFILVPMELSERDTGHLNRAVRCINAIQTAISARLTSPLAKRDQASISWQSDFSELRQRGEYVIAISSLPFDDRWFSHSTRGLSIVSTAGWSDHFSPPGLTSFLMMEIALSFYIQISDVSELSLQPHVTSVGCLLDLCAKKREISWKLRCGGMCETHEGLFRQHGASPTQAKAVQRVLEVCRLSAFGRFDFDALPERPTRTRVFIGSAGETRRIAFAVQQCLEGDMKDVECTVWTDGVFRPSESYIHSLVQATSNSDFAIFLAGRDDIAVWRGDEVSIPRDNVTFELGLFMGSIGKGRTFVLCPEAAPKLPSDLSGVVYQTYRERDDGNWEAAVRPAVARLAQTIRSTGIRDRWSAYLDQ